MTINKKISLLALGLFTLPSCIHVTEEPTDQNPTDGEMSSGEADAGTESPQPGDQTEGPSPNDGGTTEAPEEGDGGTEGQSPDAGNETSEPVDTDDAPDGGLDTVSEPEPPPPDEGDGFEKASFFMPTIEPNNTVAPRIRIDAEGGVHAVYAAYVGGGAYYAYCKGTCDSHEDFDVVHFPTDGTVGNAMLTLTDAGKPRILLSNYLDATYATCDDDCTDVDSWDTGIVLEHDSDLEISGEALALDKDGNPHFLSHTYRAYLGFGQEDPYTYHQWCTEEPCTDKDNWTTAQIATQIWEENNLVYDSAGVAHLGFVALAMEDNVLTDRFVAYGTCAGECAQEEDWSAVGLAKAYTDHLEAINLTSGVSLVLTKDDHPRLLTLAKGDDDSKQLIYFECDEGCDEGNFTGSILSTSDEINVGLDLALDDEDRPRFVYTLDYNIFLASCDDAPCSDAESEWKLHTVEAGSDMPPDDIILYPNCSVAAWFLHSPVMELDAEGNPFVGYQARDISGGVHNADPTKPDCVAGTDMTLTRMTRMVRE